MAAASVVAIRRAKLSRIHARPPGTSGALRRRMFDTIDNDTLEHVIGAASSPSTAMLVMAAVLAKRKPSGFNIDDDGKKKLFEMFKGQLDKKAKPAEGAKK
jgi:hypothetical protein